jgi:phosphatidylserine/phosphatidylglycerophosphate/cardiolipin synthase-like enzyme
VDGAEEHAAPPASSPKPEDWLLEFTSTDVHAAEGDGRPWGDGTAMAQRAYDKLAPWDGGCLVTPWIGGDLAMIAMRTAFEDAIMAAEEPEAQCLPPGQRGHVYIADWQLNALRDLSSNENRWRRETMVERDQTALGLVLRMMSVGIVVRLLLWMPTTAQGRLVGVLALEHWNVAAAVQDHDATLRESWGPSPERSYGVVALDLRTAAPTAASLHQKMVVVRVGSVNLAFVGGVDLAFTRRDFGLRERMAVGKGDWQSGWEIPLASEGWPKQSPPPYGGYPRYPYCEGGQFPEDLPAAVYGSYRRHWYDHHLEISGPAVAQVEQHFAERWVMECATNVHLFKREESFTGWDNQVQLTSQEAIGAGPSVLPLPTAQPVRSSRGKAIVQTWRTIPLRPGVSQGPFVRGEFTVMAGIAKAVSCAKELITIWDQYFWSVPLARLLAARLMAVSTLRLLIVLPPYGTTRPEDEMALRLAALQVLWDGLSESARSRVLVRNMWSSAGNVGVYVHAKSQTYDEALLVCGSANMNRRSTQCDAELDCAVLEVETVRMHLRRLFEGMTGTPWSTYSSGWLARWWEGIRARGERALIPDPFFAATIEEPRTPNGVPIPYRPSSWPYSLFEPTSIGPPVETSVCGYSECRGDPRAAGRLDEISYLLERCHSRTTWPWRIPATSAAEDLPAEGIPRLTL